MRKPTGLPRDSSLGMIKAPGKMFSCREAQIVSLNIGASHPISQMRQCLPRLYSQYLPATTPAKGPPAIQRTARRCDRQTACPRSAARKAAPVRRRTCRPRASESARSWSRYPGCNCTRRCRWRGRNRTGNGNGYRDQPARGRPHATSPAPTKCLRGQPAQVSPPAKQPRSAARSCWISIRSHFLPSFDPHEELGAGTRNPAARFHFAAGRRLLRGPATLARAGSRP
jgi:hypothetical protein